MKTITKFAFGVMLLGLVSMLSSCKDDISDSEAYRRAKGYNDIEDLKEKLIGDWAADLGSPEKNIWALVQYSFVDENSSKVISVTVNDSTLNYEVDTVAMHWEIEDNYPNGSGDVIKVVSQNGSSKVDFMVNSITADSLCVSVSDGGEAVKSIGFNRILTDINPQNIEKDVSRSLSSQNSLLKSTDNSLTLSGEESKELRELAPCWMGKLSDATKLRDLSIPGAHDAATEGVPLMVHFAACCQEEDLRDQFEECGVRAFDLRVRSTNGVDGIAKLFHNCIPCNLTFKKAIQDLDKMLTKHSSECIILIIKTESNELLGMDWVRVIERYFKVIFNLLPIVDKNDLNQWATLTDVKKDLQEVVGNKIIDFKPNLTLGEARGKFVIINRNDLSWESNYGARATGWDSGKQLEYGKNSTCPLEVQDEYEQKSDETRNQWYDRKKKVFKELWEKSSKDRSGYTWYVNCASGYVRDGDFPDYLTSSNSLNPELASIVKEEKTKGRGIILQDYCNTQITARAGFAYVRESLIKALLHLDDIERYFKYYYVHELSQSGAYLDSHGRDLFYAVIKNNFKPDEFVITVKTKPDYIPSKVWLDKDENKQTGLYHLSDEVTLHVNPVETRDYTFMGWYDDNSGKFISKDSSCSIKVNGSADYVAVFYAR